jgi:hypothetical protein
MWRYTSIILNLGTRWRRIVSVTPRPLYPGERNPGTHWIGGWVGSKVGLDAVEKRKISYPCRESNPGRPSHGSSVYRLSCPGSILTGYFAYWEVAVKLHAFVTSEINGGKRLAVHRGITLPMGKESQRPCLDVELSSRTDVVSCRSYWCRCHIGRKAVQYV